MAYHPRRRKKSVVREERLSYGTSGNGESFQAHVLRELKAIRGDIKAMRREQDVINERLVLLITGVADGVVKLNRRMDRQDRINRLILREFKSLRRHR